MSSTPEEFVLVCMDSSSIEDVAEKLSSPVERVRSRYWRYVNMGVRLKRFTRDEQKNQENGKEDNR